jgi:hypothetical protein
MGIHIRPEAHQKKHEPKKLDFSRIPGHREHFDRAQVLKAVGEQVGKLREVISNHRSKQKIAKLLSEEN